MTILARVISLKARAKRSSDYAFNIGGVIELVNPKQADLGGIVSSFDVRALLYPRLGDREIDGAGNETGRLIFDSAKLRETLAPHAAFTLSNESIAADLDQAILRRQNQYLARYQFIGQIQNSLNTTYPAKLIKLKNLLTLADSHFQALHDSYNPGGGMPSSGVTSPKIVMATRLAGIGAHQNSTMTVTEAGAEKQTHSTLSESWMTKWDPSAGDVDPATGQKLGAWIDIKEASPVALSQETISISENDERRHPNLENQIRHERVVVDLLDEILGEEVFSVRVPHISKILANELAEIDMDVRRIQVQFIETYLLPRAPGRVTAVQKDVGDNVRAGETVFRVEDDSRLLLSGQLKCLGLITVGQAFTLKTNNVFETATPVAVTLAGKVVSVRGYDSESDKWNVILECDNSVNPRLPLGYDFEPDPNFTFVSFP